MSDVMERVTPGEVDRDARQSPEAPPAADHLCLHGVSWDSFDAVRTRSGTG